MKTKNILPNMLKLFSEKQINDTIDGKCIFLCYQPGIPKSIQKKIDKKADELLSDKNNSNDLI